ncbi:MAG: signal peptidase I [Corallococcus sp.]|nr:signal peptidase I [Corallococcus sp.]
METDKEEQLNPDKDDSVFVTEAEETVIESDVTTNGAAAKKKSKADKAINIALWIAIALLVVMIVLRLFVFSSIRVIGDSMTETYHSNDVVTISKVSKPKRGDVIVFYKYEIDSKFKAMFASKEQNGRNQPYERLIKRVIALEGDRVWVQQISPDTYQVVIDTDSGRLFEDYYVKKGAQLDEFTVSYDKLGRLEGTTESNPLVIEKGCIFVMGDNREESADSRGELGQVPLDRLYGVVLDK